MLRRRNLRRLIYTLAWRLRFLSRRPWRQIAAVLSLTAAVCLVSSVMPAPRITAGSGVVTVSTDHPSEVKPTAAYRSSAVGTEPKSIRLPGIKAEGFIQKVGIDQHNQIAVPTNIHLAGWFTSSVQPGQPGLSIIDGHLDGYHQPGIFSALAKLKAGDTFEVARADGKLLHYRVKDIRALDVANTAGTLFSQAPGITSQLNLITCGGTFNKLAGGYDQRVVVISEYLAST